MLARLPVKFFALTFFSNFGIFINPVMSSPAVHTPHYRADGVRITHNPFAPGMAAKYGAPGATDRDGFDPYADSVGAGIYSGTIKRREDDGSVLIGAQYQGHNPRPGPVYSGGGYTPISRAIAEFHRELLRGADESATTLARLLDAHPDLVNDVEINWLYAPMGRPEFLSSDPSAPSRPINLMWLAGFRFFQLEDVLTQTSVSGSGAPGTLDLGVATNNNLYGAPPRDASVDGDAVVIAPLYGSPPADEMV
jgi:hypothetical protein